MNHFIDPDRLINLMRQYFETFGDKSCCFEDLKPYTFLEGDEQKSWTSFLEGIESDTVRWHFLMQQQAWFNCFFTSSLLLAISNASSILTNCCAILSNLPTLLLSLKKHSQFNIRNNISKHFHLERLFQQRSFSQLTTSQFSLEPRSLTCGRWQGTNNISTGQ